jgi:HSP20 family protein
MPHIKFDPMKELEFLSHRMRKFADEFPETFSVEFGKGFEPKVDIFRNDSEIHVVVELPGMNKSAIALSYADGTLKISGNKAAPEHGEDITIVRNERSFGEFKREIALGKEIDPDSLTATMSDGILTVVMKKKQDEAAKERSINID